jgi:hypothetical protein
MHQSGVISSKRVSELICPYHIKQIESDAIDRESLDTLIQFIGGDSITLKDVAPANIDITDFKLLI